MIEAFAYARPEIPEGLMHEMFDVRKRMVIMILKMEDSGYQELKNVYPLKELFFR